MKTVVLFLSCGTCTLGDSCCNCSYTRSSESIKFFPPCSQKRIVSCNIRIVFSKVLNGCLLLERRNRFLGHPMLVIKVSFLQSFHSCIFPSMKQAFSTRLSPTVRSFKASMVPRNTLFAFAFAFLISFFMATVFVANWFSVIRGEQWTKVLRINARRLCDKEIWKT